MQPWTAGRMQCDEPKEADRFLISLDFRSKLKMHAKLRFKFAVNKTIAHT